MAGLPTLRKKLDGRGHVVWSVRWSKAARWERIAGWWAELAIRKRMARLKDETQSDEPRTDRGGTGEAVQAENATAADSTTDVRGNDAAAENEVENEVESENGRGSRIDDHACEIAADRGNVHAGRTGANPEIQQSLFVSEQHESGE